MLKRKRDDDELIHNEETDQFVFITEDFSDKIHHRQHIIEDNFSDYHLDHELHGSNVITPPPCHDEPILEINSGKVDGIDDENLLSKTHSNIPALPWTNEEDLKLTEAIELYAWGDPVTVDWEKVSEHVETNRTADQCAKRWNNALKYRRSEFRSLPWTKEEDDQLELAVKQFEGQGLRGGVDWEKVRMLVSESRSVNQCRARWNGILKHRTPQVKNAPWTCEEDNLLIQAVGLSDPSNPGRRGSINWISVSQYMGGNRTPQQCSYRWNRVLKARGIPADALPWTDEEDNRLHKAAVEFAGQGLRGGVDWQKVSARMGGARSAQQYCHRWNRVIKLRGTVNKNIPWTTEEDDRLIEAVSLYEGQGLRSAVDWGRVSEYMGGDRTSQQCCHRWTGVLKHRTTMKNAPWTREEDIQLTEAVNLFHNQGLRGGISWGKVSEYMNKQRSCQQCAHRWNRVLKQRYLIGQLNTADWTAQEDEILRNAVHTYEGQGLRGGVDWGKVADQLGTNRTSQQCCTRWNRVLKNNHQVRPIVWTENEDQKLLEAVNLFRGAGRGGTIDWGQVSEYLGSGRTREQNCGRWNGVLKYRVEFNQKSQTSLSNEDSKNPEDHEGMNQQSESDSDQNINLFDM